jgi:hypothetical protein
MIKQSENMTQVEKQAFLRTVGKVLKEVDLVAGTKGFRAGLKELGKHKGPMFALPKGALKKPIKVETYGKETGGVSKFVLQQLGDTAHSLLRVSEGVIKGEPVTKNISRVAKNFGKLLSEQVRGSAYKVVPKSKSKMGKTIKGKGLFKHHKIFDRKVMGKTSAGGRVVRKRKGILPFSMALTPVGFGAGTFLLGSGKKNEGITSRTGAGLQQTALWSLAPPVAQAKLISDMLK